MLAPRVTVVTGSSAAARAGLRVGDELLSLNGQQPRDVIEYHRLVDGPEVQVVVRRAATGETERLWVRKEAGEPLGVEVSSAVFDRVRTCDNHCSFCFIYQLPKGMRRSLYLKDDDYRLSFLYGNFTTLTRFTELDAERVLEERLSPLYVSIHATDPEVRAAMLKNPKGATSLRWLRLLLDAGIEVHGQVVVCPGVNDGLVLEDTLAGVLDEYPALSSVGLVPLGLSDFSREEGMRPHTPAQAAAVCEAVDSWQARFTEALGRRMVYAADEYYLLAGRDMPAAAAYDGYLQHENGIGMARAFQEEFVAGRPGQGGTRHGFFSWVDGAPAEGYRAPRQAPGPTLESVPDPAADPGGADGRAGTRVSASRGPGISAATRGGEDRPSGALPVTVLTGAYGARVLEPLLRAHGYAHVEVVEVPNHYFGGNIGVTGLLTGQDLSRRLQECPVDARYLLPDVCLSSGRFLDGLTPADLPRQVEIVPTTGAALRAALDADPSAASAFPKSGPGGAAAAPVPVPVAFTRAPVGAGGTR